MESSPQSQLVGLKWILVVSVLLLGATPGRAQSGEGEDAAAYVVWASPGVTVPSNRAGERPVRLREIIQPGVEVRVEIGASAELLCSTDRLVKLRGRTTWRPNPVACAQGKMVDPGTFQSLSAPGVAQRNQRTNILEFTPRTGPPNEEMPTLLSPRWSRFREASPTITWTAVNNATGYLLEVDSLSYPLELRELHCRKEEVWEAKVCSFVLAEEFPGWKSGQQRLRITALTSTGRARGADSQAGVERLTGEVAEILEARHASIQALPTTAEIRSFLWAGLCLEEGLRAEAVVVYQDLLEGGMDSAMVEGALSEAYQAIGLGYLSVVDETSRQPRQ